MVTVEEDVLMGTDRNERREGKVWDGLGAVGPTWVKIYTAIRRQ